MLRGPLLSFRKKALNASFLGQFLALWEGEPPAGSNNLLLSDSFVLLFCSKPPSSSPVSDIPPSCQVYSAVSAKAEAPSLCVFLLSKLQFCTEFRTSLESKRGEERAAARGTTLQILRPHVFLSLEGYKEKIDALYDQESVVFIRGGVACGKTTLAHYLATKYREEYVNVPYTDAGTVWKERTIKAVKTATKTDIADGDFRRALQLAKEKGLTFDL